MTKIISAVLALLKALPALISALQAAYRLIKKNRQDRDAGKTEKDLEQSLKKAARLTRTKKQDAIKAIQESLK